MKKMKKIVVDETVSEELCRHFLSFLRKKGYDHLDIFFIKKQHSGMPDSHIVHHLLDKTTFFLTTDRPLHNTILSQGLKSYYYSHKNFTSKKIKGIKNKELTPLNKEALVLKDNYRLPKTDIRPYLLPSAEKSLKKLRTKRRRIRNHFGGYDNLNLVAITISWKTFNTLTLIGVKFRISTNIGKRALDASENYYCERIAPEHRDIVAINYAFILSIQLILHSVETHVYFDSPKMTNPAMYLSDENQSSHAKLLATLYENFSDIEFIPSTKGRFIERLRAKLEDLSVGNSNEIIHGNMSEILNNVKRFYHNSNE
jgi:hypothetical protein